MVSVERSGDFVTENAWDPFQILEPGDNFHALADPLSLYRIGTYDDTVDMREVVISTIICSLLFTGGARCYQRDCFLRRNHQRLETRATMRQYLFKVATSTF